MPRRKRDTELGTILAQINQRNAPPQIKNAQAANPPTSSQIASYGRSISPPVARKGAEPTRAFSTFQTENTVKGNPRLGQKHTTFIKRDESGDVYKYHQYVDSSGKRKVFRVGGPQNRSLK